MKNCYWCDKEITDNRPFALCDGCMDEVWLDGNPIGLTASDELDIEDEFIIPYSYPPDDENHS